MKLSRDPFVIAEKDSTAESIGLARWYDSQSAVRRLRGIKYAKKLRVVVEVEPTHDNDDIYPTWYANTEAWIKELSLCTGSTVELQLIDDDSLAGMEIEEGGVIIADLFWRDATLAQPSQVP